MKIIQKYSQSIFLILLSVLIAGCATYYTKNIDFQNHISQGNFESADNWLNKNIKDIEGKNKLLYYLNRGYVSWILQNYNESNH
ncbi:MAG: hypothetical protein KAQ75_05395, partial [Bacteroidales bacterium]|nr:hypothetical protein [Bacteroidales bacterium]